VRHLGSGAGKEGSVINQGGNGLLACKIGQRQASGRLGPCPLRQEPGNSHGGH
jgi:hypothetical protein